MVMKKSLGIMIAGTLLLTGAGAAAGYAANDDVPLRKFIENMQGKVTWNDQDRSVAIEVNGVQALIRLNQEDAVLQGKTVKLNKKPYLLESVTRISPETAKLIREQVLTLQNKTGLERVATYKMPGGKAEISASTIDGKQLVVTEADLGSISILNIEDVKNVKTVKQISFKSISEKAEVTSVAVTPDGKYALAAVRTGDDVTNANKGFVAAVDLAKLETVKVYDVGVGPDSIAVSKNGLYAVVAIEDEEINLEKDEVDMSKTVRPGSIAVISFTDGDALKGEVTNVSVDLSTTGNGAIYPHDPQPEYVAISPDSLTAAVTLQENNAVAIVDLKEKKVVKTFGLGETKHKADLKADDVISITEDMTARPEPDGIAFSEDGKYLLTANEGDLGKDEFKDKVKSGGRNIMVWDLDGNAVYDSLELVDKAAAQAGLYPDKRSANRGSEVENLTIGNINGKPFLAVAAERDNAILFFDVTDPKNPVYKGLIPSGGESPEGIHKVNGRDLFVSSDEASGIISFYGLK